MEAQAVEQWFIIERVYMSQLNARWYSRFTFFWLKLLKPQYLNCQPFLKFVISCSLGAYSSLIWIYGGFRTIIRKYGTVPF